MVNENFNEGAFILSRSVFNSDIWFMPPEYLKIWIYIIGKANHKGMKYRGHYCERGQYFCDYRELNEQLKYNIGYRKNMPNENFMKNLMKFLRSTQRITTLKKPRGVLITVLNYTEYQNLDNYEKPTVKSTGKTTKKLRKNQEAPSINKNGKNGKNVKNSRVAFATHDDIEIGKELAAHLINTNIAFKQKYPVNSRLLKKKVERWAIDIEKMRRIDNVSKRQILMMLEWIFKSEHKDALFWRGNIQSGKKLREKFPQLVSAMEREYRQGSDVAVIS